MDVLVANEGTVVSFRPVSEAGKAFIEENVESESWQWLGDALVVDHRYAEPLIQGMLDDGLELGWA